MENMIVVVVVERRRRRAVQLHVVSKVQGLGVHWSAKSMQGLAEIKLELGVELA